MFAGWALVPRMLLSALLIAPLGYFLGMPFPKLTSEIPEFVDWAFAVTGSASVIGSVLIIFIAMSFGYSFALCSGLLASMLFAESIGFSTRKIRSEGSACSAEYTYQA